MALGVDEGAYWTGLTGSQAADLFDALAPGDRYPALRAMTPVQLEHMVSTHPKDILENGMFLVSDAQRRRATEAFTGVSTRGPATSLTTSDRDALLKNPRLAFFMYADRLPADLFDELAEADPASAWRYCSDRVSAVQAARGQAADQASRDRRQAPQKPASRVRVSLSSLTRNIKSHRR